MVTIDANTISLVTLDGPKFFEFDTRAEATGALEDWLNSCDPQRTAEMRDKIVEI